MNLRSPRPGEEAALAQLSEQLGYPSSREQIASRLAQILPRDDQLILIADDADGRPIGWIHALVAHRLMSDTLVEVAGLVVAEEHRSAGVGGALLAAAEQWARARGLSSVRVRSNVVRERAHGFYLRSGYVLSKTSRVFDKRLD
jgi:GNAT superfamily N-acetyltransferase